MGQHDMNDSQQAHRHSRKRSNKSKSPTDWIGRDFCQANVQAHREIRGNSTSPRAQAQEPTPFMPWRIGMNIRDTQQNETWQEWQNGMRV